MDTTSKGTTKYTKNTKKRERKRQPSGNQPLSSLSFSFLCFSFVYFVCFVVNICNLFGDNHLWAAEDEFGLLAGIAALHLLGDEQRPHSLDTLAAYTLVDGRVIG